MLTDPNERAVVEASTSLVADAELGDDIYTALVDLVGEEGVIELVVLVGYYDLPGRLLRVMSV